MGSSARLTGIILTLLFALDSRGDVNATCAPETTPGIDFSWLSDLETSLKKSIPRETAPVPVAPEAVVEPDDVAKGRYDLGEPELSRLRKAARKSAAKCRSSGRTGKTGRTLCGIHVSKFLCYRGVKDALAGAGLVDGWWSEMAASDAHENGTLSRLGFKNVMSEGYRALDAPLGSVLVYSGGSARCRDARGRREPCGHIEIKLNEGEYCSDYCKSTPVDRYLNRKLIGVYVKE